MAKRKAKQQVSPTRSRIVFASLVGAMTLVGGLLWGLDRGGPATAEGLSLPALMAPADSRNVGVIFDTTRPLERQRWTAIVITHTASPFATPASLEAQHKAGGLSMLGHHFLIGNGNGLSDGELFVGPRWLQQVQGAHAVSPKAAWLNEHALSICLVGDGNRRTFTDAQMRRLVQVVNVLSRELGIPREKIYLQSEVDSAKAPGGFFPTATFRSQLVGRN